MTLFIIRLREAPTPCERRLSMTKIIYEFKPVTHCDMCGSGRDRHRMIGMRLNGQQGKNPRMAEGIAVSVKRCLDCQLIFADPQPVPANLADHYGAPAEDYWIPEYFEYDPSYFASEIATAKHLLGFQSGMTALDIGAGLGKCMKSLGNAGFDAYGIEPSQPFHEKAISTMGTDPGRLRHSTVENARFSPGYFDFITFGAVLEHLYEPSRALAKAMEWLKPGGIIQIEVPSSRHLVAKIVNLYFRLRGTNYVTNISPMHVPFHLFEFGLESFRRNALINGYEVAHHEYSVCHIFHLPRIVHPPLRWWMKRNDSGMQLTVYLRKPPTPAADVTPARLG